jgi:uncharacterized protein YdeI (YjbR/CyaY-like superfamily)
MEPVFFAAQTEFRKWLEKNQNSADELLVGFWKVGSGKPSMTWSESVDQALCFGWIDGIRRKLNDEAYTIRFTPRRQRSVWSRINIDKVEDLKKKGLMKPAGLAAFEKKDDKRAVIYSYENQPKELEPDYEKRFRKYKKAWDFFESQAASYRRLAIYWVMSAKQEATRRGRLEKLIAASRDGKRI